MAMASKLVKLSARTSALFVCDMQEKFRSTIQYFPQIVQVASRLVEGAKVLEMPIVVTEQYPKGLGSTVNELNVQGLPTFAKTQFSMLVPDVREHLLQHKDLHNIVICGIEAHACVKQTVVDLLCHTNYNVHVVIDAVSSRSMVDRMCALDSIQALGAHLTTCESVLLGLLGDAAHPKFRTIQRFIMDPSPDSGLASAR